MTYDAFVKQITKFNVGDILINSNGTTITVISVDIIGYVVKTEEYPAYLVSIADVEDSYVKYSKFNLIWRNLNES